MFIFVSQELVRKLKATPESKELEDDLRNKGVDRDHIIKRLKETFGLSQRGKTFCLHKLEIKEYPFFYIQLCTHFLTMNTHHRC
jgi:hypothetical protein